MSYSDLLARMMQRDVDAFLEFTDLYGWSVYHSIRRIHPDKEEADRIYQKTMEKVWRCLQDPQFDDPMEALLCTLAQYESSPDVFRKDLPDSFQVVPSEAPPSVQIRQLVEPEIILPEKKKHHFFSILLILLLVCVTVWVVFGFLMERGLLPFMDLGYSWFCRQLQNVIFSMNQS